MKLLTIATIALSLTSLEVAARPGGGFNNAQNNNRRIVIDMNHAHYRGQGQKIFLKRMIQQKHPRIRLQNFNLQRVRLRAKSKHGRGTAVLLVGQRSQDRANIPGRPRNFRRPGNYHPVVLQSFGNRDRGAWQVELNGNIKVNRVVVVLKRKHRPGGGNGGHRYQATTICTHKPDPFLVDKKVCRTNQRAYGLKLQINKNDVDVSYVQVTFRNGQTQTFHQLSGMLGEGSQPSVLFRGARNVVSVKVGATSTNLFGKARINIQLLK